MSELLATTDFADFAIAVCCTILSIGIAGAMMIGAARRNPGKEDAE